VSKLELQSRRFGGIHINRISLLVQGNVDFSFVGYSEDIGDSVEMVERELEGLEVGAAEVDVRQAEQSCLGAPPSRCGGEERDAPPGRSRGGERGA